MMDIFSLSGKKALVTGGAGGIGKACALGMAKAGADVAIVDLKKEMGEETVAEIKSMGRRATFIYCDITDVKQVENMVQHVVTEFGRLDIAFNNAGIGGGMGGLGKKGSIEEESLGIWAKIMDVNLHSVFYCCREEAKYMIPQRFGKIINTASMSGIIINNFPSFGVGMVAYCTAKAGVRHLTKALAMEWVPYNIFVNSISPGYVITPMTQHVRNNPELLAQENLWTPMHRQAQAEEMVGGVIYLASDSSSFTTGHDLVMDGGVTVW